MPPIMLIILGLFFLIAGAYVLVEGASKIAQIWGVPDLIIGLTIVAIGTSAPELLISMVSAMNIRSGELSVMAGSDIILGNVVGSNIANLGLILGLAGLITPIAVEKVVLKREFLWMLGASLVIGFMAWDQELVWWEGVILLIGMVAFSFTQYRLSKAEFTPTNNSSPPPVNRVQTIGLNVGWILAGILGLALGSDWLVQGATQFATDLGVSEFVIGLTIVAVGTSLPELSTALVGAYRGGNDLVLGNVAGSNIYNLLLIVPSGTLIHPLIVADPIRQLQIPLMIGISLLLYILMQHRYRLDRPHALALLSAYMVIMALGIAS